ncbi:hypothetical protein M0812_02620 [Anaeramoeba flamelloides]|uniref:Uncharacterized protein n=1 Tax=Anaeramoeba flamelloides TaxID=1746091 RepID=A0AAV7YSP6_9EUKA|nr:hypothetical protein M0812_02620 [Anaeramoeba flamelloides]
MSIFKRVFKISQSKNVKTSVLSQQLVDKLFSQNFPQEKVVFPSKKTSGYNINTFYDTQKNLLDLESRTIWFMEFAKIFMKVFEDWNPSNVSKKKSIKSRVLKKKNRKTQSLQNAILENNAQPTILCIETLRTLVYFRDLLVKDNQMDFDLTIETKFDLQLENTFFVFEMIKLLSRSKENQKVLLEYGLMEIISSIGKIVNFLFHKTVTELSKVPQKKVSQSKNKQLLDNYSIEGYIQPTKEQVHVVFLFSFFVEELLTIINLYPEPSLWDIKETQMKKAKYLQKIIRNENFKDLIRLPY